MKVKDDGERRSLTVRLLDEEMAVLEQKASEAGMSKSEFIRQVIRQDAAYPQTNFSKEARIALQRELNHIGNNLNLIDVWAHSENSTEIDEIEFLKLSDHYHDLLGAIYKFINGSPDDC